MSRALLPFLYPLLALGLVGLWVVALASGQLGLATLNLVFQRKHLPL